MPARRTHDKDFCFPHFLARNSFGLLPRSAGLSIAPSIPQNGYQVLAEVRSGLFLPFGPLPPFRFSSTAEGVPVVRGLEFRVWEGLGLKELCSLLVGYHGEPKVNFFS